MSEESELQVRRERDLYLRLLRLGDAQELEPFLREALALIVEVTGARLGYLQVDDVDHDPAGEGWWMQHGFSEGELAQVRASISQGIVAQALETGETIMTASALLDPRFRERGSVRASRIESVLCAPIGRDPRLGVLYLQGRTEPGTFTEEDRSNAEVFARHLAPLADRLLTQERRRIDTDATRAARLRLRADGVIGRSAALARVLQQVALVAPLELSILLTGETGTGKSQLARVIHDNSLRASGPFIELNCAALPDNLIESELFGAMPGAHSTATKRIEGKLAAATQGTLLLDEVGDLSLPAQAKLLQLLQSGEYFPLGAARSIRADVRIIAATNTDLAAAMAEHRFREDLFYRLHVLPIHVPSLAERRDDIGALAQYFCAQASERHRLPHVGISPYAQRALEAAEWPGNVRQLAHSVEAATIRAAATGARWVERGHFFPETGSNGTEHNGQLTFQEATRRFHVKLLRDTLDESGWSVIEAARRLDLARSHVYNLIRALGIERPK
ncbi:MAG TPA: sigma-54-dependent Fis family transcriptional regulator [Candidatus Eisenbacteria bacterium]|nr:sigma-54-dependent Fis family transcriptional regulator [Candidatus Eisenbacteria bacterium]